MRQWTALDCAASIGKEKIVELLIDAEADVDPKDIASVCNYYLINYIIIALLDNSIAISL